MIPISVLLALFRSMAELSGTEGLHGQCLPTHPWAESSKAGSHQGRCLAVPAKGNQRHLQLSLREFPASLFSSLLGWSFSFISHLPHCRRAVIRTARASSCLHICVRRASSPADPDSLSDDPLPLPSFSFPVHPWISSPALPLTAARGSRVPEPGLFLGTLTRDEATQGWENKGQLWMAGSMPPQLLCTLLFHSPWLVVRWTVQGTKAWGRPSDASVG